MYYNSGDRQNSLSVIAILITRLNTKAAIPYSLTCHCPHPEQRGTPPAAALLTQTPRLHVQLMFMHVAISILLPRKDNTLAHPTPRAGTPSWAHISPGPSAGSSEEMLGSPTNSLEAPGVNSLLHQECCARDVCSQDASEKHTVSRAQPSRNHQSCPPCLDIPRHEGFCPEDTAKVFVSG